MKTVPILFEDHSISRFRPLSWSLPLYELRVGMFNLRERLELVFTDEPLVDGHVIAEGQGPDKVRGGLLPRDILVGLHRNKTWSKGPQQVRELLKNSSAERFLWLNGRLAPDYGLLETLLSAPDDLPDWVWFDGRGLLAGIFSPEFSLQILDSWTKWEQAAAAEGAWFKPGVSPGEWPQGGWVEGLSDAPVPGGWFFRFGPEGCSAPPDSVLDLMERISKRDLDREAVALDWVWEIVPRVSQALDLDLTHIQDGLSFRRSLFGIFPESAAREPLWEGESWVGRSSLDKSLILRPGTHIDDPENLWVGDDVSLGAGVVIATGPGPVVLDRGVEIQPHVYLEGPLYIGPGTIIKAGSRILGETSIGAGCRIAGEVAETTCGDLSNKQHDGFIGHSLLGSWVNLGALTTCSDLKNNYGPVRVDLGEGPVETGQRFIGLMLGDHAKTAIGTLFDTGTSVGFAANIFGSQRPPKFVGNFCWGGTEGCPLYEVERALNTAAVVMGRRGCKLTEQHRALFTALASS